MDVLLLVLQYSNKHVSPRVKVEDKHMEHILNQLQSQWWI